MTQSAPEPGFRAPPAAAQPGRPPVRTTGGRPGPLRGSIRLGQVGGVPVLVHWTVLVLFALLAWVIAAVTLPEAYPGNAAWAYAVAGLSGAAVFLFGLLAHEVSHAVVARRHGIEVESITLWLLGGLARLGGEAAEPETELRVAGVGPLVSLLLGGVFGLAALALAAAGIRGLPLGTVAWLSGINVLLAVFNLLPAAPLDGGRVLHAVLWKWRRDRQWATAVSTRFGQALGLVLVALGLSQLFVTGSVGGLWMALIGWFVASAATREEQQDVLQRTLAGVAVREVMSAQPDTAPPDITVADFVDGYLFRRHHSTYPLVEDGRLVGLVTLRRVKRVPPERRATTTLRQIACPAAEVPVATPEQPLVDLIPRLNASGDGRALVFDGAQLVGVVSPTDISRAVEHAALRRQPPGGRPDGGTAWRATTRR